MIRWARAARGMTPRDVASRLYTLGFPALFLVSVPFLIGTHTIYASNVGEFALPFSAMAAPWLLAVVGVTWGFLTALGLLLSDRLVRMYGALLFGVGLLLWGLKPRSTTAWKSRSFTKGLKGMMSRIKGIFG